MTTRNEAIENSLKRLVAQFEKFKDSDGNQADAYTFLVSYAPWATAQAALALPPDRALPGASETEFRERFSPLLQLMWKHRCEEDRLLRDLIEATVRTGT